RGLVEDGLDLNTRRQVGETADDLFHRVDDFERIAARDAEDIEVNGFFAGDGPGLRRRRAAVFDARDVFDEDGFVAHHLDRRVADERDLGGDGVRIDVGVEFL